MERTGSGATRLTLFLATLIAMAVAVLAVWAGPGAEEAQAARSPNFSVFRG